MATRPQSKPAGSARALRAARKRSRLPAPIVMGRSARSSMRFEGSLVLLEAFLPRRRSSTPQARLSEQARARDGRSTDGPAGSTNSVAWADEGSGALDVLCTLGLRLLASSMHEGSTYSSSSSMSTRSVAAVAPDTGLSTVVAEKRNDESVACTSRQAGFSERREASPGKLKEAWLGPASLGILVTMMEL